MGDAPTEWVGSKAHLSESCDAELPNLVTDVHTTAATEPDVVATTTIQDRLINRGLSPSEHITDASYSSAATITASTDQSIALVAPVTVFTGRNAKQGTFTPSVFERHVVCFHTWECPPGALCLPV